MDEGDPFAFPSSRSGLSKKVISIAAFIEGLLLAICVVVIGVLVAYIVMHNDSSENSSCSTTLTPTPTPSITKANSFYFFQISDLHSNLNYTSETDPIGNFGEDAGLDLLEIALRSMKDLPNDPEFILITGDFPTHNLPTQSDQINTITQVSRTVKNYFPDTAIYPAMGNNDVFPDYYFPLNTNTTWMEELSSLWGNEMNWLTPEQLQTFNPNGYYFVDSLWDGGPRLIVLNTLLYSAELVVSGDPYGAPTPPDDLPDDPNGQFAWLTTILDDARTKNLRVILQYHIPSGINAYDGSRTWHSKFTGTFEGICEEYSDVILIHFAAHYHTDDFRLMDGENGVLLNPSISPIHTNNPAFRSYIVEDNILSNYYQYYVDLVAANNQTLGGNVGSIVFVEEYNFRQAYGFTQIDGSTIHNLLRSLHENLEYYMKFLVHEYVYYPWRRGVSLCAFSYQQQSDYLTCIDEFDDDEN
mmetsp:Transcript_131018/g.195256  ORF Transcript_131018/g.195256 Transcript_131018/m.195256 type:complete len:470 (-) Transcript_131018:48-1457(-)